MGSQPVGIIWNIISRSGKYISSIQPIHEESSSGAEPLYFNFFIFAFTTFPNQFDDGRAVEPMFVTNNT